MKNKLLKELYDCFYVPPELPAQKQEIEECHQALIEALEKPERRLVLQIIDAKDRIVEDIGLKPSRTRDYLNELIAEGIVVAEGSNRNRTYRLKA